MNYLNQLEKAVMFIENNLSEDIKVEEIASAAGYSYYHFHRVFEAVLGETLGNYIRSRRLNRAANDLLYTDRRILDIAIAYQFNSQEAFHRAFKKNFKVSPATYRKNRIDAFIGKKNELTLMRLKHLSDGLTIQPSLRQIEAVRLIGLRYKTTLHKNRAPEMWNVFNSRVHEITNRVGTVRAYGICEADSAFNLSEFNVNSEFSHFIGTEVSSFHEIPQGMNAKTLAGGKYAVFTHKGKMNNLKMTYDYIWGTWALCSGFEIDMRDDFDYYDERFLGRDNDLSEFDICIPVK